MTKPDSKEVNDLKIRIADLEQQIDMAEYNAKILNARVDGLKTRLDCADTEIRALKWVVRVQSNADYRD